MRREDGLGLSGSEQGPRSGAWGAGQVLKSICGVCAQVSGLHAAVKGSLSRLWVWGSHPGSLYVHRQVGR